MVKLWEAARDGELGTVKRLVESGANIEEPSDKDLTPLMWAVQKGQFDVAEYLGANIEPRAVSGLFAHQGIALRGCQRLFPEIF